MIPNLRMNRILFLFSIIFISACGTFEIGIENNVNPETQIEERIQPTNESVEPTAPAAIQTPIPTDEQLIAAALSENIGQPSDQLALNVTNITGEHATGSVSNGYFLAVKQEGNWLIVYDGQANPPCSDVEMHQFPSDMVPECVDTGNNLIDRTGKTSDTTGGLESLDCGPGRLGADQETAEYVACNIQDGLRSRNLSALLGYMEDPFIIGYWLSEGVWYTPEDFLIHLPQLYNFNDPDYTPQLTFTTDRSQFPELDGRPVEGNFGPDVNVVEVIYSQGWGVEGDQEVMIYLTQDSAGNFKWHSMLIGVFDPPIPSP